MEQNSTQISRKTAGQPLGVGQLLVLQVKVLVGIVGITRYCRYLQVFQVLIGSCRYSRYLGALSQKRDAGLIYLFNYYPAEIKATFSLTGSFVSRTALAFTLTEQQSFYDKFLNMTKFLKPKISLAHVYWLELYMQQCHKCHLNNGKGNQIAETRFQTIFI